jgi:hypothetical protein
MVIVSLHSQLFDKPGKETEREIPEAMEFDSEVGEKRIA